MAAALSNKAATIDIVRFIYFSSTSFDDPGASIIRQNLHTPVRPPLLVPLPFRLSLSFASRSKISQACRMGTPEYWSRVRINHDEEEK